MSDNAGGDDWFDRGLGDDGDDDWFEDGDDATDDEPGESWEDAFDDDSSDEDADDGSATSGDDPSDTASDGDDGDDGSLFEQDFGSALNDADVPDGIGGDGGGSFGGPGGDDAFGGGGGFGDDGGGFGDDGGPFGGGGGFDDGAFGGASDFDGESLDDSDLDSDIPRIDLGIEGLDEMIQGGVPERSLMVAIGSAGTGKTTFGLQFLNEALERGERAVYITLEESRSRVVNSATEKGMPFDEYVDRGDLAVVDIDPIEMANSLASIQNELPRLIKDFGASRLVLDSVSLLEMMYDDQAKRRNEIYDFTDSLKDAGVTTMLTSEASEESPYNSRHGIVEYLTDAVFVLQYVRPSDFRETRLAIEIQKIRDANHSRETKPYDITNEGISVYRQANIF